MQTRLLRAAGISGSIIAVKAVTAIISCSGQHVEPAGARSMVQFPPTSLFFRKSPPDPDFFSAWVATPLKMRILPPELTKAMKLIKETTTTPKTRDLRKRF